MRTGVLVLVHPSLLKYADPVSRTVNGVDACRASWWRSTEMPEGLQRMVFGLWRRRPGVAFDGGVIAWLSRLRDPFGRVAITAAVVGLGSTRCTAKGSSSVGRWNG